MFSVKMQEIVHWSDKTKHVTAWIICRPYQHIFKQNNAILCRKKYLAVLKNIWDFRPGRYISLMPVIPTQEQTLFDDIPARTPYWLYHSNIYKHRRQHKILILLATQAPPPRGPWHLQLWSTWMVLVYFLMSFILQFRDNLLHLITEIAVLTFLAKIAWKWVFTIMRNKWWQNILRKKKNIHPWHGGSDLGWSNETIRRCQHWEQYWDITENGSKH